MGRVSFTSNNKATTDFETFPKLKLTKGERARIVCLEDPHVEYVHNLRAPKILNGQPIMIKKKKFKSDEFYETYDEDFLGNPLCIGDPGILADKGSDPDNCPACAAGRASDSVKPPQRRFAMHVIKYAVKQGSNDVQEPFQVSTVVWAFTDMVFNQLVDIATEFEGGLPKHDLLLGPCTDADFQKFEIMPSQTAQWLVNEERKKLTVATFKGNQAADLSTFCGSKKSREWIEEALLKVKARWNIVNNAQAGLAGLAGVGMAPAATQQMTSQSLAEGLDDLLGGSSTPAASTSDQPQQSVPAPDTATAETLTEVVSAGAPKPGSSGETVNFDDLIGELSS